MTPFLYPDLIIDISCQEKVVVCWPQFREWFSTGNPIISCWFCSSLSKVVIEVSSKTGIVAWHFVLFFFQVLRVRDCWQKGNPGWQITVTTCMLQLQGIPSLYQLIFHAKYQAWGANRCCFFNWVLATYTPEN